MSADDIGADLNPPVGESADHTSVIEAGAICT